MGLARKKKKRVGRGHGSGHGKTSCRGHKGQGSRSGGTKAGFEGGQTPLYRRLPKMMKFKNYPFKVEYSVVNLSDLIRFKEGTDINLAALQEMFFGGKDCKVKILGDGDLKNKFNIEANKFSETAKSKIEAAGGKCSVI